MALCQRKLQLFGVYGGLHLVTLFFRGELLIVTGLDGDQCIGDYAVIWQLIQCGSRMFLSCP